MTCLQTRNYSGLFRATIDILPCRPPLQMMVRRASGRCWPILAKHEFIQDASGIMSSCTAQSRHDDCKGLPVITSPPESADRVSLLYTKDGYSVADCASHFAQKLHPTQFFILHSSTNCSKLERTSPKRDKYTFRVSAV